jgi:hypothetical protein
MHPIRRSRSTACLLAVAFLVAASGCGEESTDLTLPPAATWAPAVPPEPVATVTATAVEVSAPYDALESGFGYNPMTQWLVPWEDGFLALGVRTEPQPLPDELAPEIAELFPPEVTELFPDGLPATQQEAMDILDEAGLLDVVMDILNENPEAMDALQSEPRPDPALVAMWSIDGDEWTPTEVSTPTDVGWVSQFTVAGDRLTVAGAVQPVGEAEPWIVTVASTTDLENWDTARFTVAEPEGLPEEGQMWVFPVAVAADDEHWVARIMADSMADPESGMPYGEPRPELWSGAWDGDPTMIETGGPSWMLVSTSEGFLDLGPDVRFSSDGQTWTAGEPLGPNVSFQAAAPLGDGVLAITTAPYGDSSILLLDATGTTVEEVEIPELGDRFVTWGGMSSPAFVAERVVQDVFEQAVVVEHEGFELTQEFGAIVAYELVDLATGDVVAEESVDLRTTEIGEDGPFEHLAEDMRGITITDPDTDETIVEIPQWVVGRAWQDAQQDVAQVADQPERWLLATTDGETWLLEQPGSSGPDEFYAPMLTAVNGSTVLTGTPGWEPLTDVWQRYSITE